MNMKTAILLITFSVGTVFGLSAATVSETFNSGFANGGNIPDGNPNPWSDTRSLSGITDGSILSLSVRLDISGGYNGDLYSYLSYNGVLVPLLNRVGVGSGNAFGYNDSGLRVTFTDSGPSNIHFYQASLGYDISSGAGQWRPDGRMINPLTSAPAAFDAPGTTTFASFNGMNPNGDWTLVVADTSSGGGQAQLMSWGLDITTVVPEPTSLALAALGALLLLARAIRAKRFRQST